MSKTVKQEPITPEPVADLPSREENSQPQATSESQLPSLGSVQLEGIQLEAGMQPETVQSIEQPPQQVRLIETTARVIANSGGVISSAGVIQHISPELSLSPISRASSPRLQVQTHRSEGGSGGRLAGARGDGASHSSRLGMAWRLRGEQRT